MSDDITKTKPWDYGLTRGKYDYERSLPIWGGDIHYEGPTIKAIQTHPEFLVGRVLDIGCSSGYHLFVTAESDLVDSAVGIDINQKKIDHTANLRRAINDKVSFVCGDVVEMDNFFVEDEFDSIQTFHTLEHWFSDDHDIIFKQIKRVLKNNGHLMIVIPLDHHHNSTEEHHTWWTSDGLQHLFESYGFETVICEDYISNQIFGVFKNIKG